MINCIILPPFDNYSSKKGGDFCETVLKWIHEIKQAYSFKSVFLLCVTIHDTAYQKINIFSCGQKVEISTKQHLSSYLKSSKQCVFKSVFLLCVTIHTILLTKKSISLVVDEKWKFMRGNSSNFIHVHKQIL